MECNGIHYLHFCHFCHFSKIQPKSLIFSDLRLKIKKRLENIFFGLFSTRGIYIEVTLEVTSAVVFFKDKEIHRYKLSVYRRWVVRGT